MTHFSNKFAIEKYFRDQGSYFIEKRTMTDIALVNTVKEIEWYLKSNCKDFIQSWIDKDENTIEKSRFDVVIMTKEEYERLISE